MTPEAQRAAAVLRRAGSAYEAMGLLAEHGYLEARHDLNGNPVLDSFGAPVYRPTEKFIPWLEGERIR